MNKYILWLLSMAVFSSCQPQTNTATETDKPTNKPTATAMDLPAVTAPEINTDYGWLNTDRAYTLKDFRGKIVLLDFWTFGCINCQHIIPDLKRLEKEYAKELVVIGVHSAKFESEKTNNNIRKAILKFGIEHPVVNDADFKVWESYGVKAWPTITLISPDGKVVGQRSGEGVYPVAKKSIDNLIKQYGDKINREPITFKLEKASEANSIVRFPSKLISDEAGNIWLSDSGNNRVVKINKSGKILEVIGKGEQGFTDGDFATATFYEPHGLAIKGNTLYIADSKNNSIRKADLTTKQVETVAGDGEMGYYFLNDKWEEAVKPNSPWDLLIDGNVMYIANAGNHQVLKMDLATNKVTRFAGSGREALTNGTLREAAFNQPSGLTKIGNTLYVADPEASAVRTINLQTSTVATPVGRGLFDFGDKDGDVDDALLQHCVGVAANNNNIYIADTYNGKVKLLDLKNERISTLVAGLNEPNDLLFIENELWVTDTNNHQLVKINLKSSEKNIVTISQ
ncbi:redoxin domain-containing protein [Rhodocytophaga aerolata]|uniref:Redoxin domain-containing protein n=1 Tax=Rhodocytophaga aerolata TaxID=455078 RepID=A0ABT8R4Q2_9BACT|nr:thioredoxin-like domain-containing protein [Rhodocytophaga aerolata]MDO1447065.1 redoxin domain-containing protein [Rhodocytophaga aerolata]